MKDLVLIIEDNLVQQKMLKSYFEEILGNYTVKVFSRPTDLVKHLKKNHLQLC